MGRRYGLGGPWVLRGVDMELPPGSLVRIAGANGTGKSTLLRLLAGIDVPSEGRLTGRGPRTAYVPERFPAALPFTAAGYLVHLGRVQGLRTGEAAARGREWLTRFGAYGHARTPLAELSKGTSQKVAVAQALMADPGLLVLDEAWTGLDPAAREELDRAVAERVAAGATVVFVDHDPHRLAGAVDVTYAIDGSALTPMTRRAVRQPSGRGVHTEGVQSGVRTAGMRPGLCTEDPRIRPEAIGARVRMEATGPPGAALPPGLPGAPTLERGPAEGMMRLTVPAAHSDALLRTLLSAPGPWHIERVEPAESEPPQSPPASPPPPEALRADLPPAPGVAPARPAPDPAPARQAPDATPAQPPPAPPTPAPPTPASPPLRAAARVAPARAVAALVRYQSAHLLRSQRWLAPVLLYVAFLAVGIRPGQPVLDSLGYAAAGMVPVTAWIVRLCATQEPPAARTVAAAVVGQPRLHLCVLLAALGWALALGAVATTAVLLMSEPVSTDGTVDLARPAAGLAGLLATVCCVLVGATVGALSTRPLLHRRGWSVVATVLGVLIALVGSGSPAKYAVSGLVSGSLSGTVPTPVLPLAGALAIAAAAAVLVCRLTSVRE